MSVPKATHGPLHSLENSSLNLPSLPSAPLEKIPQPRLGELSVTEETSDSVHLSWTVAQGPFDSFLVQYKDRDGQLQAVPVAADQREATVEGLQPGRKYKFLLYGLTGGKRLGPISAVGVTGEAVLSGLKTKELTGIDRREGERPVRALEEELVPRGRGTPQVLISYLEEQESRAVAVHTFNLST